MQNYGRNFEKNRGATNKNRCDLCFSGEIAKIFSLDACNNGCDNRFATCGNGFADSICDQHSFQCVWWVALMIIFYKFP